MNIAYTRPSRVFPMMVLLVAIVVAGTILTTHAVAKDRPWFFSGMSDKAAIYTEANKGSFKPEYAAPPALRKGEQMKEYPNPKAYVAFSLRDAQHILQKMGDVKQWRSQRPDVFNLGGIDAIVGAVHDKKRNDLIIVGKYVPGRQPLTLDDLAIALRAIFVHADFPLVSIDPTAMTKMTGKQDVRLEAGIENTQFGADLLDADYRMKLIGFDFMDAGVKGFVNKWKENVKVWRAGEMKYDSISTRYWFEPIVKHSCFRDGVAMIDAELSVGVFIEVMAAMKNGRKVEAPKADDNPIAKRFAKEMTERYDELAKAHPCLSRMRGLQELTALATVLKDMDGCPNLDYWLTKYAWRKVETPATIQVVGRVENRRSLVRCLRSEGGARLTAVAVRLSEGDVGALRDVVLKVRPKQDHPLTWQFILDGGFIVTLGKNAADSNLGQQYANAQYYFQGRQYDKALKIIEFALVKHPDISSFLALKGATLMELDRSKEAVEVLDKAIVLNLRSETALFYRGRMHFERAAYKKALADLAATLKLRPRHIGALAWRARTLYRLGRATEAKSSVEEMLRIQYPNASSHQYALDQCLVDTCYDGHTEFAKGLLDAGASVHGTSRIHGVTSLWVASQGGHTEVVELLLKAGAKVNVVDRKYHSTPLYVASCRGHSEIVKALVAAGAKVNASTNGGATPLLIASKEGHAAVARALIVAGAKVNMAEKRGATPLHMASQEGHAETAIVLVAAGAKVDARGNGGWTSLYLASQGGHVDVVKTLLEAGADVDAAMHGGWTPLHVASQGGYVKVAKALLKAGARVNAIRTNGAAPLHDASQNDHVKVAKALLAAGAKVDAHRRDGATPLLIACRETHQDVALALLAAGADPLAGASDASLSDIAAGNAAILEALADRIFPARPDAVSAPKGEALESLLKQTIRSDCPDLAKGRRISIDVLVVTNPVDDSGTRRVYANVALSDDRRLFPLSILRYLEVSPSRKDKWRAKCVFLD